MPGNRYEPLTTRGGSSSIRGKRSSRRTPSHPSNRARSSSRRPAPSSHYNPLFPTSTSSTSIPTISTTTPISTTGITSSMSTSGINKLSLPPSSSLSTNSAVSAASTIPIRAPRRRRPLQMVYVDSVPACREAVSKLSRHSRIALDCEGVALSRTGRLCLLQMASPDCIYIFDLIASDTSPKSFILQGGLKNLLEADDIYKVTHDCRHDSDALYHQYGIKLNPIVDTQVIFAVLRRVRGMPACLPVSLRTLLKKFAGASENELVTKSHVKGNMADDEQFWLKRPLSPDAIKYARMDVEYLLQITQLLSRYIQAADKLAWNDVLKESQEYLSVFRDDADGPRKAQLQYEQMARVARRQRNAFEQQKRVEMHRDSDPMRKFTFDVERVVSSIKA